MWIIKDNSCASTSQTNLSGIYDLFNGWIQDRNGNNPGNNTHEMYFHTQHKFLGHNKHQILYREKCSEMINFGPILEKNANYYSNIG